MLKMLVYGYSYGVKSSRKLERETHNNLSFIWLMGGLKPDHKTIAEFRRNNKTALQKVLKQCARFYVSRGIWSRATFFLLTALKFVQTQHGQRHVRKPGMKRNFKKLTGTLNSFWMNVKPSQQEQQLGNILKMKSCRLWKKGELCQKSELWRPFISMQLSKNVLYPA